MTLLFQYEIKAAGWLTRSRCSSARFMKTLALIPIGIFAVSFLVALIWSRRSKDRVVARYRLLVIVMLTLGVVVIGMAITNPIMPPRGLGAGFYFLTLAAIRNILTIWLVYKHGPVTKH